MPVTGAAFLADGVGLVTATCANHWEGWQRNAFLRLWSAKTGERFGEGIRLTNVRSFAVLADGRAVTGGNNSEVQFWDLVSGEPVGKPRHTGSPVVSLGVSRDGSVVLTGGADFRVRAFENVLPSADTDQEAAPQPGEKNTLRPIGSELYAATPLRGVALAPDGNSFLTCDTYSARLWRLDQPAPTDVPLRSPGKIAQLALNRTGSHVVTRSDPKGELRLWDAVTGSPAGKPFVPAGGCHLFDLTPDGQTVLVLCDHNVLRRFHAATGEQVGKEVPTRVSILDVRVSPDGRQAVVGTKSGEDDGNLLLFDLDGAKSLGIAKVSGWAGSVFFAADGRSVFTGTWHSTVYQFAVPALEPVGKPVPVFGAVGGLAATADGKTFLAGAHGPGHSILGRTESGRVIGLPLRHLAQDAAFTPDGRIALTGNRGTREESMLLWDVASGKQVGPYLSLPTLAVPWHRYPTAAFADNHTVVAVRPDGVVRRWPVPDPIEGSPTRLGLWVQALTGMRLDTHGGVSMLSAEDWQAVRQNLDALSGSNMTR
jgi:WD40 repeat protein